MEIKTQRLVLRPVTAADLETTYAYAGNLGNTHFMMFLPYASLEETAQVIREAETEWRKDEPARWEFAVMKDGAHIGGVTLYFQEDRSAAELGWVLHQAHWGKGYTVEAAQALIDYAREHLGIRRIFACCDSENNASRRVMEKLGMQFVSCLGGRWNRSCKEERKELTYEILL